MLSVVRIAAGVFLGLLAFSLFVGAIAGVAIALGVHSTDTSGTPAVRVSVTPTAVPASTEPTPDEVPTSLPPGWADCGDGYHYVGGKQVCAPDAG